MTDYAPITTPGCIVKITYVALAFPCRAAPTHAGLVVLKPGNHAYLAFACPEHADQLIAARLLLDRDRAELDRRRHSDEWARVGHPPLPIDPLATGAAATRLVERARAWAARHGSDPQLPTRSSERPTMPAATVDSADRGAGQAPAPACMRAVDNEADAGGPARQG